MKQSVRAAIDEDELIPMDVDEVLGGMIQVIPEGAPINKPIVNKNKTVKK